VAKFVFVYLFEAHATNEWPLGDAVVINRHESLDDRIAAAKLLQSKYNSECDIYVDDMNNAFNGAYSAWPERFYIVSKVPNGPDNILATLVSLIAQPSVEDQGFNRDEISRYLYTLSYRLEKQAAKTEQPATTPALPELNTSAAPEDTPAATTS